MNLQLFLQKDKLLNYVTSICVSCLFLFLSIFVPLNMDEFGYIDQIGCIRSPQLIDRSHNYSYPCNQQFNLKILGKELPLRTYSYIGISGLLFYYPLYQIWPAILSFRLLKLVSLFLMVYVVSKLSGIKFWQSNLLVGFFLPVLFQLVVDTGPVFVQLGSILLFSLLVKKAVHTEKPLLDKSVLFRIALAAILLFISVESKPVFVFMLPIVFIATLVLCVNDYNQLSFQKIKSIFIVLCSTCALSVLLLLPIFLAKTVDNQTYLSYMFSSPSGSAAYRTVYETLAFIKRYFVSFQNFGHRIYNFSLSANMWTLFYWFTLLFLTSLTFFIAKSKKDKKEFAIYLAKNVFPFYFLAVFTSFGMFIKESFWAGHHIILVFPYILLGTAFLFKYTLSKVPKISLTVLVVLVALNIIMTAQMVKKDNIPETDRAVAKILNFLKTSKYSEDYILVTADWGIYYPLLVYGNEKQYLYDFGGLNVPDQWKVAEIRELYKKKGKKGVIFISLKSSRAQLKILDSYFSDIENLKYTGESKQDMWELLVATE